MKRKNPASSANIELTPLLDVIFIILFIVIISNALNTKKATAEAGEKAEKARLELLALESEAALKDEAIESLEAQIFDQDAMAARYEQRIDELEGSVIGRRVKIVSISCVYREADSAKRRLTADAPDASFDAVDFGNDTAEMAFARLNNWLEQYIGSNTRTGSDKSERVIIVLSVGAERILKRDRDALDRIIAGLEAKYDDVY